jgi:hypothetical protein
MDAVVVGIENDLPPLLGIRKELQQLEVRT